jgi:microsomal dipeptidase-like Zn-dependent dipeptidase
LENNNGNKEKEEENLEEVSDKKGVILLSGFDHAIVGFGERNDWENPVVVYDRDIVIQTLVKKGLSSEEAARFYEENIVGVWKGDATPVFISVQPMIVH